MERRGRGQKGEEPGEEVRVNPKYLPRLPCPYSAIVLIKLQ
jgi:hypothetical protein